ncbi:alanyl-tRNA editing protein [Legionella oakridgensis]|uniref:Alanyl-tRNA synthetase n=1 Tax=Legionella oakridgensis TaxID=29423 RepID=A0A0W0WXY8_9GAMM|nr:alanyl-tRNA editing protein [Legionella oakridgensis]ETO93429.1 putative metal-dependent hydrolase [Legionella oakridgensis RV-2-2007]KTD37153.1 alanyl-tRNA synthetase [Legionella oakridgensis]STY20010.1 alanyl-tRNA synthetase-like protein [Legionella longbeachae]
MRKLFWTDPYQRHLITTVLTVDDNRVLFDDTIAFSFSGGQESDRAYINGLAVIHSEMIGNLIYYILPDNHALTPGDTVAMEIDWPRRYRLMRLHFAAELVLELMTQMFGIKKIGAHIGETKARIDFFYNKNISYIFEHVLAKYNEIILEDKPINTGFSDIKQQRRFWEIHGFSKVACGGTHVKTTSEVGFITLKRSNIGRGKERIEIRLVNADLGLT